MVVILGRGVRRSAAEHGAAVGLGHRVRHRVALLRGQSVNGLPTLSEIASCIVLANFNTF